MIVTSFSQRTFSPPVFVSDAHAHAFAHTTSRIMHPIAPESYRSPLRDFESSLGFDIRDWTTTVKHTDSEGRTTISVDSLLASDVARELDEINPPSTGISKAVETSPFGDDSKAATKFHYFQKLPYELRQQIWKMHLCQCRVVVLTGSLATADIQSRRNVLGQPVSNIRWYTENRSPGIMRVCREARDEALRFYRIHLPLGAPHHQNAPQLEVRNPTATHAYINPEWDMVLYMPPNAHIPAAVLLNDLCAWDPQLEGVQHFGSHESPISPFKISTQAGHCMLPLQESTMLLKTWMVITGRFETCMIGLSEGFISQIRNDTVVEYINLILTRTIRPALRHKVSDSIWLNLCTIRASVVPFLKETLPGVKKKKDGKAEISHGLEIIWEDNLQRAGGRLLCFR